MYKKHTSHTVYSKMREHSGIKDREGIKPRQSYAQTHTHTQTHTRSVSQPNQGIQPGYKTQQEGVRLPKKHSCHRNKKENRKKKIRPKRDVRLRLQ